MRLHGLSGEGREKNREETLRHYHREVIMTKSGARTLERIDFHSSRESRDGFCLKPRASLCQREAEKLIKGETTRKAIFIKSHEINVEP